MLAASLPIIRTRWDYLQTHGQRLLETLALTPVGGPDQRDT
jgi:hypothetical protein